MMSGAFGVGEALFHPAHGITEVQAITSMSLYGQDQRFYVLRSVHTSSQFFVPVDNADKVGLRRTMEAHEVELILATALENTETVDVPWRERHRRNVEKVSTGAPALIAEVVRELAMQDRERRLPATSQRLLERARQMLAEEIAFVTKRPQEDVERALGAAVSA